MPIGTRPPPPTHWQDWVNLILGVWLLISPWVLNFAGNLPAATVARVGGSVILIVSVMALIEFRIWQQSLDAAVAFLVAISPFVLGFDAPEDVYPMWNHLIAGCAAGVFALWNGLSHPRSAGASA